MKVLLLWKCCNVWNKMSSFILTKVDVGLCDEPRLVVGVEREGVGHQLFDRDSNSFHVHGLDAAPHK